MKIEIFSGRSFKQYQPQKDRDETSWCRPQESWVRTSEDSFETMNRTERTLLSWSVQIQWPSLSNGQKEIYFAQNQTNGSLGLQKAFYGIINCNIYHFYIDSNRSQKWFPSEELNSDDLST